MPTMPEDILQLVSDALKRDPKGDPKGQFYGKELTKIHDSSLTTIWTPKYSILFHFLTECPRGHRYFIADVISMHMIII